MNPEAHILHAMFRTEIFQSPLPDQRLSFGDYQILSGGGEIVFSEPYINIRLIVLTSKMSPVLLNMIYKCRANDLVLANTMDC